MGYYDDYVRDAVEQAFDYEKAEFSLYDSNQNEIEDALDEQLNKALFNGAMREMVVYLYSRRSWLSGDGPMELLFNSGNIANIYVSSRSLEAPTIVVEYDEVPEWFEMEDATLREFYWYPNPARSGEWSAGYFQPREH